MEAKKILETTRLVLREFNLNDSEFIYHLLNTPTWLEYIGDKNVRSVEDAEQYLINGPLKSYKENGFGLWLVQLKNTNSPVGMCGLIKRETLDDIDIGFAMLPEYARLGYGYEIASATMSFAKYTLNISKIVAITSHHNTTSINLLNKLGLRFEKTLKLAENDYVLLFSPSDKSSDKDKIDRLTDAFFNLFTNTSGHIPELKRIWDLFIPEGSIINNTSGKPEIFNLDEFITPRQKMLTDGTLVDFREHEISNTTEIFGNIAQRLSLYEKSGKLHGVEFHTKGIKTIQFVKVNNKWKIFSVAWSDE